MPSYTIPYAPPVSQRPDGSNISRLLMRGGEIAADRAERSAQIWGGTVANLGQLLGGAVQQHQAGQAEKKIRAREGAQDQAFFQLLDSSGGMPEPAAVLRIYGPERGTKVMQGLVAFHDARTKRGEEAAKRLPDVLRGYSALSEAGKTAMWPKLRELGEVTQTFPGLPPQRTPEIDADIAAYLQAQTKPPEDFTLSPGAQRRDAKGNLIAENPTASQPVKGPAVGSFEDYAVQRFGPRPTAEQIATARREYAVADNAPAGEKPKLTPTAEANLIQRLATQWTTASKPARAIDEQVKLMDTAMNAARSGNVAAGAEAVQVTFQKILDPESVVRESEFDRSASGLSLASRAKGMYERLTKGGHKIPLSELEKFAQLAKEMAAARKGAYLKATKKRLGATADRYGIPNELVFEESEEAPTPTAPGKPNRYAPGGPGK